MAVSVPPSAATAPAGRAAGTRGRPAGRRPGARSADRVGWLFIAPNILGVLAFTVIPLISVVVLAFTDWNLVSGLGGIRFTGIDNFTAILSDPAFWSAAARTAVYAGVSVPATVLLGLLLAVALNRDLPGRAALRVIFFLPYVVTSVAVGMIWLMIMNPSSGIVNEALRSVGLQHAPAWFASSHWALPALIVIAVWSGVGYAATIYLAALQDAPAHLYEAARLDGAGAWTTFRAVTWPAVMPTTVFLTVTLLIGASQGFGLIALITSGGPGDSTTTLSYYLYQNAFRFYRFGYASAIGLVTFAGVLVLTLLGWRLQKGRALHD